EVGSKAAGESQPQRRILTGPAKPRRSVCAPTALASSLYRRPPPKRSNIMHLLSWLQQRPFGQLHNRPGRKHRPTAQYRPRLELLEDRTLPSAVSFSAPVSYAVGSYPNAVAVGDFDGDGTPDLAVTNQNSNSVSLLLDNRDGTFQTARNFAVGATP